MIIQVRRGLEANRTTYTPQVGEPLFTTDTKKLYIGDGTTPGGVEVDLSGTTALDGKVNDTGDTMTGNLTMVDASLIAGTSTNVIGTALAVIRNAIQVGRIDNNANGLRIQAQAGTLQLRGTGNTGISVDASGNAAVAGAVTGSNLSGTNTGDHNIASRITPTGAKNGINMTYTLPVAIIPGSLTVTLNGLVEPVTEATPTTFVFSEPPISGDTILCSYQVN